MRETSDAVRKQANGSVISSISAAIGKATRGRVNEMSYGMELSRIVACCEGRI